MTEAGLGDALVIGGASGIGESTARLFARRGRRVWIADRNIGQAIKLATELGGTALEVEVTDERSIAELRRSLEERGADIEAIVISVGMVGTLKPPVHTNGEDFNRIFQVNVTGPFLCCRELIPQLAIRRKGSVVLFSSVGGMGSSPYHAYGPSKTAIITVAQNMAVEWGRSGVRVNCISPGAVDTPMSRANFATGGPRNASSVGHYAALGRIIQPEEVASVAEFLCSEGASAITGANIVVDAGSFVGRSWAPFGGVRPIYEPG